VVYVIYWLNRLKEPKKPSLFSIAFSSQITPSYIFTLLLLQPASVFFETIQPYLMKRLLEVVVDKQKHEIYPFIFKNPDFPYVFAILLIICPFMVCEFK
jgi:hypothetical protein